MATSPSSPSEPTRLRDRLAGQHLLITGATGFLARAFVEKLLRSLDTVAGVHLLVRPRSDGTTAEERLQRDVLGSSTFNRLRAAQGAAFDELCREKVHAVSGDLTRERFGLSKTDYRELAGRITMVVNSAATVTFDERLDLAIELNTYGPQRLLEFAREAGNVPFLHVSTCYVCGQRTGNVLEDLSAPSRAEQTLPRVAPGGDYDLTGLLDEMKAETLEIRHRYGADTELCRRQLIEAGMRRARQFGWNDTYTFTKWLGEQLLARNHGDVPLAIFRPAIIEGSYAEPTPGWIDGLRMADPLFVAYGRGKLAEFPADPDVHMDLIPVDFVANAMFVALPAPHAPADQVAVYHCASTARNPLRLEDMVAYIEVGFRAKPMLDERGRPIYSDAVCCIDRHVFLSRWQRRRAQLVWVRGWLERFGIKGKRYRRLSAMIRQVDQLIYFARIYAPYTHLSCRFDDDQLHRLADRLHEDDRREFPFDAAGIDWRDYLAYRHLPGLRSYVLGTGAEPSTRLRQAAPDSGPRVQPDDTLAATDIFEVFRRSAERYRDKPALQVRRGGRWLRYTYEEALHATGAIMRRFQERGLSPGDRIALIAESCPEWGLTYLAAMRAGLTVTALDPQLPADDAWAAARFVNARLVCASAGTHAGLAASPAAQPDTLVLLAEPFIPPPAASRDVLPDPIARSGHEPASILFTSGTTVSPKAVVLTHRNFIANARALVEVQPLYPTDEFLSVLPMYHAFEFTGGFLTPLSGGATITYVEHLKGPEIRAAMQATGTSVMMVVPRLLRLFHDAIQSNVRSANWFTRRFFAIAQYVAGGLSPASRRLLFRSVHQSFGGRLRLLFSGAAKLDPEVFRSFQRMGFLICEGYGLTEASPVLTVNPADDVRAGSVGRALPNIEVEVRNVNLEGIGEVWARGPSIMGGYLDNPDATAEMLSEGWLRTGDLGRLDEDGYLFLTGRSRDLIVTSAGKNVYPDEVESAYRDLPHTNELCVLAMPAADGVGDAVHAVIVLDTSHAAVPDRSSIERDIRAAAETIGARLPSHQRITAFHFWERELPKTSTLKAKRGLIRDALLAEGAAEAPLADAGEETEPGTDQRDDSPGVMTIRSIVARHAHRPVEAIRPGLHLSLDLGIDSIGKIDLLSEIEARFRMQIDDETAAKTARVSDLLRLAGWREPKAAAGRNLSVWQRRLAAEKPSELDGRISPAVQPVRWLLRSAAAVTLSSYIRVAGRGQDNLPTAGPFLLAPNHSSHLDAPTVLKAVGGRRRVWIAGAEDYFFSTKTKRFLFGKVFDTIPFDRRADGMLGLRRCARALQRGDGLLLFPEGTRSVTGQIHPFKVGIAVLSLEQQVPIVPVHIAGAFDLLPKGSSFPKPGRVVVSFGAPIMPPDRDACPDRYAAFSELISRTQAAVEALAAEVAAS